MTMFCFLDRLSLSERSSLVRLNLVFFRGKFVFRTCSWLSRAKTDGLCISVLSFIRAPPDTKAGQTERDMEESLFVCGISLMSGQLVSKLFPD